MFPPVMAAMSKTNCFGKRSSCFPTFQLTFVSTSRRVPTLSDQQRSPPASFLCVQSACHRYHSKHRPSVSCQPSLCAVCTSQIPQQAQTVCVLSAFSVCSLHVTDTTASTGRLCPDSFLCVCMSQIPQQAQTVCVLLDDPSS